MDYIDLYPARYNDTLKLFRPSAMVSYTYGKETGDPRPGHQIVEEEATHEQVAAWATKQDIPVFVGLLGTNRHGVTRNLPTTLLVMLPSEDDRERFKLEVMA